MNAALKLHGRWLRELAIAQGVLRPFGGLTGFHNFAGIPVLRIDAAGRAGVGIDHYRGERMQADALGLPRARNQHKHEDQ